MTAHPPMVSFLQYVVFEDRVFFGFFFGCVRIDHYLLDLRPSSVASDVSAVSVQDHKWQHYAEGQEGDQEGVVDDNEERDTYQRRNITLESEGGEDKGVLDYLEKRKVEGDNEVVDIKSHYKIYDSEEYGCVEHERRREASEIEIEEYNVVDRHNEYDKVDDTHDEALAEIAFDSVPEVVPGEDGLALDKVTQNVGSTDVGKSEGEDYQRAYAVHDLRTKCGNGYASLHTVNTVKRGGKRIGGFLHRAEESGVYGRSGRGGCVVEQSRKSKQKEYEREIAQYERHVYREYMAYMPPGKLEKVFEGSWDVVLL